MSREEKISNGGGGRRLKQYRIGDYAKYLGVSPDFLKHYEQQGIIRPSRSESGYRYYSFETTMKLIESIRLRNYGMTLREIREILTDRREDDGQVQNRIAENIRHLEQEIRLDEALIRDFSEFAAWRAPLEGRDWDWEVRTSAPMLFLPHTNKYDFLPDPRIYELLREWMSYIPIVKSTMRIGKDGRVAWGFVVSERDLRELGLPVNDVVETVPSQKILYCKFRSPLLRTESERFDSAAHPVFRLLRALHLTGGDFYFRTTLMPADWQQSIELQYGYYAIPIKTELLT
ncbi:MAG: MerR family transcriptional regulator [Oscillospiraceae bacterium]|nr:MerR family transcriptional regulator [Oscillospiraceae bacterium]